MQVGNHGDVKSPFLCVLGYCPPSSELYLQLRGIVNTPGYSAYRHQIQGNTEKLVNGHWEERMREGEK